MFSLNNHLFMLTSKAMIHATRAQRTKPTYYMKATANTTDIHFWEVWDVVLEMSLIFEGKSPLRNSDHYFCL